MPTKQELHKLIDEFPDELTDGIYQAISDAVAIVSDSNTSDTRELTSISASALLRDWDSDEDSVYDDD